VRVVGIDLARTHDYTVAVALNDFDVTLIEQFPHGLRYREIVEHCGLYIDAADYAFVDATGIGDPVLEMLREDYIDKVYGIKISGGKVARVSGREWLVPKTTLMDTMSSAFSRGVITVSAPDPGRSMFEAELQNFLYHPGTRPKYGARTGHHDDIVLAVALAIFGRLMHPNAARDTIYHEHSMRL